MPLPSSQSATRPTTKDAYEALTASAGAIKQLSAARSAEIASGPRDVGVLVGYLRDLVVHRDVIAKRAGRAGVQNYARDQLNDSALVLSAEWAVTAAAIDAVIAWLFGNLPKNAAGFLQYEKIAADGSLTLRTMTVAEMAPLVPLLDAVVASVD